ncbi:FMN-linked oxidoreductase [Neolentinus lepideus HHB14362 ss-1]|uniref:FMN-linked oxidoreductase n=1 Tax=Neolentinus lepideus HHB14362 ss-1 TaxID=1314782 RepID=A0A165Q9U3_9AGAM|nr:FMN-linked oxidoreductase [Neolentinus lepideus HHB14362 ss-1]
MSTPPLPSTSLHTLRVCPTLMNSSCAWASDLKDLMALYNCKWTGAVVCRTATRHGFREGEEHGVVFGKDMSDATLTTLNTYGYAPSPLSQYLTWIKQVFSNAPPSTNPSKPFIISITSNDPRELKEMIETIQTFRREIGDIPSSSSSSSPSSSPSSSTCRIGIELNTSCPNMGPSHPPPSYTPTLLLPLLTVLADAFKADRTLTIGLKLPPFVYRGQFDAMIGATHMFTFRSPESGEETNPFAYYASTNTLGSALMFNDMSHMDAPSFVPPQTSSSESPSPYALSIGGLAGAPLHPLALGNVFTFRSLLATYPSPAIRRIKIVGIGGVVGGDGLKRMQTAGASVVACASIFGREGVAATSSPHTHSKKASAAQKAGKFKAEIVPVKVKWTGEEKDIVVDADDATDKMKLAI